MTQEALAEAVGASKATIGHLESGERRLSDKWLQKLAPVLGTTMGRLLETHPSQVDEWHDLIDAAESVPKERLREAAQMLRILGGKQ